MLPYCIWGDLSNRARDRSATIIGSTKVFPLAICISVATRIWRREIDYYYVTRKVGPRNVMYILMLSYITEGVKNSKMLLSTYSSVIVITPPRSAHILKNCLARTTYSLKNCLARTTYLLKNCLSLTARKYCLGQWCTCFLTEFCITNNTDAEYWCPTESAGPVWVARHVYF